VTTTRLQNIATGREATGVLDIARIPNQAAIYGIPLSLPVTDAGGTVTDSTLITYAAITAAAGVTFTAPTSGMVMAYLDIHLRSGLAGTEAKAGLWVKEGAVIGSGTLVQTIEPVVANATDQWIKTGGSRLIVLTPGADYNIQACMASETVDISVSASHHILTVVPCLGVASA
jgi:hypothetical protein